MNNKQKILLALFSLSFLLLVYLIIVNRETKTEEADVSIKQADVSLKQEELPVVDLAEVENSYKIEASNIYIDLKTNIENNGLEKEELNNNLLSIKNRLVNPELIVTEEYRDFHISLILLVNKIVDNNYEIDDDIREEMKKISTDNQWIN